MAGREVDIKIKHRLPEEMGTQVLTVTLKEDAGNQRIDRKTVKVQGKGAIDVSFQVPEAMKGKPVVFAAFVGDNFARTPQRIQSAPMKVK